MAALKSIPTNQAEAKQRQRLSKGRSKKGAKECATSFGKASEQAAKLFGCSARNIEKAQRVQISAPDLLPKVESGKLSISDAYGFAKCADQQDTLPHVTLNRGEKDIEWVWSAVLVTNADLLANASNL